MIRQARKKPVVVEYIQYDGHNYDEVVAWIDSVQACFTPPRPPTEIYEDVASP